MRYGSRTAILLAAAGAACAGGGGARPSDGAADAPIAVQDAPVTDTTLARRIVAAGTVAARDEVTLAFTTGGPIATLTVDEGDVVRAGQTLATLALDKTDAALTQARAAAAKAERDHARATGGTHESWRPSTASCSRAPRTSDRSWLVAHRSCRWEAADAARSCAQR
jgi:multidrug efflux pump subunit AcrA (membrane-fusion protein)